MIDLESAIAKLADLTTDPQYISDAADLIIVKIRDNELSIKDLVVKLNLLLTAGNYELRLRAVDLLSKVIATIEKSQFHEKEIEVLTEYLSNRLDDHKLMQRPVLNCFLYFVHCENKPQNYTHNVLGYLKEKSNIRNMDKENRLLVYEMIREIITQKGQKTTSIDTDLFYSLIHLIEGENEPENLISCFGIISYVMKRFTNLEPFIDDMFEWLASYYPLDYTPDRNDPKSVIIQKSDLTKALYDCFYATPLNSDNLQTMMLEKLDSNQTRATKIESLNCLIKLYEKFPSISVEDYATTLWTAVRTNCLMKVDMVDPTLLDTCYKALSAMTMRLGDDSYFTFINDITEELSIAIRKPEMDLFEPAVRLITHAVQPRVVGFNFVLNKILSTSIKAIDACEFRPAAGLSYVFEQFLLRHPNSNLIPDLDEPLNELARKITDHAVINEACLTLLKAMIRCRVRLSGKSLDEIINKLVASLGRSSTDIEESLALLCAYYQRSDIIVESIESDCRIDSLMKLVKFYGEKRERSSGEALGSLATKFSIYLRLLLLMLDEVDQPSLNNMEQSDIGDFLERLRNLVIDLGLSDKSTKNVGLIHAIVINKLSDEMVQPIVINIFQSEYCQNLIPKENCAISLNHDKYIPVVGSIFRSLVIRNHQLSIAMLNLILNFITFHELEQSFALKGVQMMGDVLSEFVIKFDREKHYQIFALHKQKFFILLMKSIKTRLETPVENSKKHLLISSIALQIPHLPVAIYKKDSEWIVREILKILACLKDNINESDEDAALVPILYECVEHLIASECSDNLKSFLGSLVELNLFYATQANKMQIRRRALICLTIIASSFKEQELLVSRSSVLNRMKTHLADKKRIVRQAAAEARLKWFLIGQPIGSL